MIARGEGGVDNRPGSHFLGGERFDFKDLRDWSFTATSQTNPVLITSVFAALFSDGDVIVISEATSAANKGEIQGIRGSVVIQDATHFYLLNHDGTGDELSMSGEFHALTPSVRNRCIEFEFSEDDTYALFFGDRYMMVARNGAMVLESAGFAISASTYATFGRRTEITTATHDFWAGDDVFMPAALSSSFVPRDHGEKRYKIYPSLTGAAQTITGVSVADPAVVTVGAGHGYTGGERIFIDALSGANPGSVAELSHHDYEVVFIDGFDFSLVNRWGEAVSTLGLTAYTGAGEVTDVDLTKFFLEGTGGQASGAGNWTSGTVYRYFALRTPWTKDDIGNLDFGQDENDMTLTCPGFETRKLARTAHDVWTISVTDFKPSIEPPGVITPTAGGTTRQMQITSVSVETGEESLPREKWVGAAAANVLTWTSVDGAFEYNLYRSSLGSYSIGFIGLSTSGSVSVDTSATAPTPDLTIRPPALANPFHVQGTPITITAISTASPFTINAVAHGLVVGQDVLFQGIIGMIEINNRKFEVETVVDVDNINLKLVDFAGHSAFTSGEITPLTITDNPTAVAYHQQRLVLANTPLHQRAIYMSRAGSTDSMQTNVPLVDADAIALELKDSKRNEIRWLIAMQQLIVMTQGAIFAIAGDEQGVVTPTNHTPVAQYGGGVGNVKPVKYGEAIIYVSNRGNQVFELLASSDFNTAKSYIPSDISILAQHLFANGLNIDEMAGATSPYPIVLFVRDDGIMLVLSFLREHGIFAWGTFDTFRGEYESICSVPEGRFDGQYTSVKRTIDSVEQRVFERFDDRDAVDVEDAFFVDSGLIFDQAYTVTTNLEFYNPLRLYFSVPGGEFNVGDLFDITHKIRETEGIVSGLLDGVRLKVKTKVTGQYIEMQTLDDVPLDYDATTALEGIFTTTLTIHLCVSSIEGLDHLEGEEVAILADGAELDRQVVKPGGILTWSPDLHSRVITGLPIQADLETLPPDAVGGPFQSLLTARLKTQKAVLLLDKTVGLKVGPDADSLTPIKYRTDEPYGAPTKKYSGIKYVPIGKDWKRGQVFIRQDSPLPATILSLACEIEDPGDN